MANSYGTSYGKKIAFKDILPVLIVIAIILSLVAVLVLNIYHNIIRSKYNIGDYEINDFNKHKDSLERIAKKAYDYYSMKYEEDPELSRIILNVSKGKWNMDIYYTNNSKNTSDSINVSDEMDEDIDELYEAFEGKKKGLRAIYITEGQVIFSNPYDYELIYRVNGNSPSESSDIYCEKLTKYWYQCVPKN